MTRDAAIRYLFEPRAVAVIGASHSREKIGYKIVENIIACGYRGKVFPINPGGGEILGIPVYGSVKDVPGEIDAAVIAIPAEHVYDEVKSCADKKVKYALIISSGFSEVGDIETEKKIVSYARDRSMRVIGPNIFGIYIAKSSLNATFGTREVLKGDIAIVTQSGALGISLMGRTAVEGIGLSAMLSLGNKSDVDESDVLEYLAQDPSTRIILMYVEGVKHGSRLVGLLKEATAKKPVIVIKAGRSRRGAMAAASHTGSLAGADNVFSDIMKQCGVIRAESIREALDWCKFLSASPLPAGENAVIITNGGGMGVMAADACEKYSVKLYDDTHSLKEIFSKHVPSFGSVRNPVDLTGQASLGSYKSAIDAALADDRIHAVICLGCETAFFDAEGMGLMIKEKYLERRPEKPVVFSFFGGAGMEDAIRDLEACGIPAYSDVYEAVSCMGALYASYRNTTYPCTAEEETEDFCMDDRAIRGVINEVRSAGRTFMLSQEAQRVLIAAGIRMPRTYVAKNMEQAVKYAEKIGYPVVLKVVSGDIVHKSDAGGVVMDLQNEKEVVDAYQAILHSCRKYKPAARVEGVQVSELIPKDVEVITGAVRDESFGPVVMCGLGGIYVEIMGDVAFRSYPLDKKSVMNMINETRSSHLLMGARGAKRKDVEAVIEVILKLGAILSRHPEISDIEINPLMVYEAGKGACAPDVRILLSKRANVG